MATLAEQLGKFELAAQHRFRLFIDEVGGFPLAGREQFEIAIISLTLPNRSAEEIEIPVGTEVIYYAGRRKVEPMNAVVRDYVDATAYAFLENWAKKIHDDASGRRGYRSEYVGTARVQLLGINDEVIREWKLQNIWPQTLNAGNADMTSTEAIQIEVTFRYDKAIATTY